MQKDDTDYKTIKGLVNDLANEVLRQRSVIDELIQGVYFSCDSRNLARIKIIKSENLKKRDFLDSGLSINDFEKQIKDES